MLTGSDLEQLRRAPLFSSLSPHDLQGLIEAATVQEPAPGTTLFLEHEPASAFYFLEQGAVKLYKLSAQGGEKVIEIIRPGETFAEAVVFLGARYPVCAQTLGAARLVRIPTDAFVHLLKEDNRLAMKMLASLSMRLHQLVNDVQALSLESAAARVAAYLLEHTRESDTLACRLPAPKHVIASRLGITPETFSRTLAQLRERGVIEVDGIEVRVLDLDALRAYRA